MATYDVRPDSPPRLFKETAGYPLIYSRSVPGWGIFLAALLFIVALYEMPYVFTLEKTGWTAIPPVVEGSDAVPEFKRYS